MKLKKEYNNDLKRETERRVKKMKKEFNKRLCVTVFENQEQYNQIIAQVGIPLSALCEHHEVSFEGKVSIGYIPGEWVVGLSKLARIAEKHMNPTVKTLQERVTQRILNDIVKLLRPKGVMVVIKAKHNCISYRGVKKPSLTITSAVSGIFANDYSAKNEFLQLVNNDG